ncbi:MAG TPA: glycosyltransferase family 2 protein [Gemmatimonadaceae bacterium]
MRPTRMSERIPITVVIATLNEAPRLGAALDTVRWADEVIVADAGSTDNTADIARSAGARVLTVAGKTIGAQRNAAIAGARNPWILALDADEAVTPELKESLARVASGPLRTGAAFRVRSRNWHLGTELRHGPWGRDWKVRVFSSDQRYTAHRVHERLQNLEHVEPLPGDLLHHPYRDLQHHVMKVAKYSRWAADDLRARGRRTTPVDVLVRPFWRFVRDYVVFGGWRDGRAGFVVSVVSAFSVFCKYATLLLPGDQFPL